MPMFEMTTFYLLSSISQNAHKCEPSDHDIRIILLDLEALMRAVGVITLNGMLFKNCSSMLPVAPSGNSTDSPLRKIAAGQMGA